MDMLAMKLVRTYGAEVLDSPEFRKAKEQKHHHVTTVGDHSLGVAYVSVKICRFLNAMHIKTDTESIVRGSSAIIWCAGRNIQRNPSGSRESFSAILTNARKT